MTKQELIQFMDELVELASEENKSRAILVKEKFINDFEISYEYEKEVQTEITELPPYYIAAMPDLIQEEIKVKVIAALTECGECTPENVERAMSSKIYDWLLVLLSGDKRKEQKYIHNYLGRNKEKYPEVMFIKSDSGKSEDMFTHLRNQIAHYEQVNDYNGYREIGNKIPPIMIRTLVKVINDVICEDMQDIEK